LENLTFETETRISKPILVSNELVNKPTLK